MTIETALVILAAVQAILLIVLLGTVLGLVKRVHQSAQQIDELTKTAVKMLTEEVKPAILDIRRAIEKIERVAEGAGVALTVAEPMLRSVSQVAGRFQKTSTPIWMDIACVALDIWGIMRKRKSRQRSSGVAAGEPKSEKTLRR
ncbi:MAG: hypothetical protein QXI19_02380 [Candidatus Caldarchaeum sp.]